MAFAPIVPRRPTDPPVLGPTPPPPVPAWRRAPAATGPGPDTGGDADASAEMAARALDPAARPSLAEGKTPEELEALRAEVQRQAARFAASEVTKDTGAMSQADAEFQRTHNAREIMQMQRDLGLPAGDGMDPRIVERAQQQQAMVDQLTALRGTLSDEALALAQQAADLRARQRADPKSVSAEDMRKLQADMAGVGLDRATLDSLPPETRLLVNGFTPEDIARHFTARDVDADVLSGGATRRGDPANPAAPKAGGDRNSDGTQRPDGTQDDAGATVRRPITAEEAQRAVEINSVLYESFHVGNRFGKLIPEATVGDMQTGHSTPNRGGVQGDYGPGSAMRLGGDVGEQLNTSLPVDRASGARPTAMDQVQVTGLDYPGSVYVTPQAGAPHGIGWGPEVTGNALHRLEGTISQDIYDRAEVCMGAAVMAQAQSQSNALAREAAAGNDVAIPAMLRRDASADGMPAVMQRMRDSAIDTKSGLGFSVSERMDMPVVANQELTIPWGNTAPLPADAQVTRSDQAAPVMVIDPSTGLMVPNPTLPRAEQDNYDDLERQSQDRIRAAAAARASSGAGRP